MLRISRLLWALLLSSVIAMPCLAVSKYRVEKPMPPAKVFNGFGVGIDGVGVGMLLAKARFANSEVMARANFKERYFPILELGIGSCNREAREQATTFKTTAPYFRIGADYCLTGKRNGNRFLLGARYGWSIFEYNLANPEFADEVYGGQYPLSLNGLSGKAQWIEICAGIETKLWKFIRLGWTMRFKARVAKKESVHGSPWYTPGFGKTGSTTWGGSVNLMFDITSDMIKKKKN